MNGTGRPLRLFVSPILFLGLTILLSAALSGCGDKSEKEHARPAIPVTVMTVTPRDVPIDIEFVGTTESSHQVEIRARVEGFLEKKTYEEGGRVRSGQTLFQIDRRPFEADLQQAKGALAAPPRPVVGDRVAPVRASRGRRPSLAAGPRRQRRAGRRTRRSLRARARLGLRVLAGAFPDRRIRTAVRRGVQPGAGAQRGAAAPRRGG